ncbi:MAG: tryptophan synthase subunit alpha [Mobiluncus porci]|uniref:tryptophan synthase subunit alpha n=1 Tax=Mobiluncus TaxID=2050 RepID=UPI0023F0C948|nr:MULTISPECIES: tryptophan synthase subunit alpha [Mobiluncus]MCI6585040.1 tryptophan synthase subunit alpha [Mobiluncus sp.]MDD7542041.1 tryptophan synthase subunit alpha [Mobiluncus porci]MDY5749384.1 tryptophan synthase subunit alpha [Mobiluncus porci]
MTKQVPIAKAFEGGRKAFIPFITAGDPSLEDTERFIVAMARAGAGIIEIGIPFSDPIAEGPVIQEANVRALSAPGGCKTDAVFEMVARVREQVEVPLVFLTYLNPVFKNGYERFCKRCAEVGVSGLIIPDLPFEESGELRPIAATHGVDVISLIAPTSAARIREIAAAASGYIYVVSSLGVTGTRSVITTDIGAMVSEIRAVTDTPTAVGFGINTPEQAEHYAGLSDGAIVGSAIVKLVAANGANAEDPLAEYVREMVRAVKSAESGE